MYQTHASKKSLRQLLKSSVPVSHPEYAYWSEVWWGLRAVFEGERAVKEMGTEFLPQMSGQDSSEYNDYVERATFYNMTGRTRGGLVGTIFKRDPKLHALPTQLSSKTKNITKSGMSLSQLTKSICDEVIGMGRHGVLLDMDEKGQGDPYLSSFPAEDILDWETTEINGRHQLSMVLLREFVTRRPKLTDPRTSYAQYTMLVLANVGSENSPVWEYQQHKFRAKKDESADLSSEPEIVTPKNRGRAFDFIPFVFFGPYSNQPSVERPPLLDIYDLNLSHYRSYAQLEHGRHFTALPVYYAPKAAAANEKEAAIEDTYTIGPNVVWEVGPGEKPGILEFNGSGLKTLENACNTKEGQISAMGGRLTGGARSVSESDNQAKLKEMNENSLLLNVVLSVDLGMSKLLRWWAVWQDVKPAKAEEIRLELNTDFLFNELGAREFRAIHAMYQDGIIPVDVVYAYLRKAEVIPDYMTLEEFKELIDQKEQFPNQNDVLARMQGYPDAKALNDFKMKRYEDARADRLQKTGEEPGNNNLEQDNNAAA